MSSSPQDPGGKSPMAMMGIGFDLAVPVALLGFVGHWLDGRLGSAPWLLAGGLVLGMVIGFYTLWKRVTAPRGPGS